MSNRHGVSEEDYDAFKNSGMSREAKEATAGNVNRGIAYEEALDSPEGRLLSKEVDNTLLSSISEIVNFKHNENISLRQNYDNILGLILKHNIAQETKARWESILRTKDASVKRIEVVAQAARKGRNGG